MLRRFEVKVTGMYRFQLNFTVITVDATANEIRIDMARTSEITVMNRRAIIFSTKVDKDMCV